MNREQRRHMAKTHSKLLVLKVTGRYPDGRPCTADILYDEQYTQIVDGTEFVTAFVVAAAFEKKS